MFTPTIADVNFFNQIGVLGGKFGSARNIASLSALELMSAPGIGPAMAERILSALKENYGGNEPQEN